MQLTPKTYERRKKRVENELKRITTVINYGKAKVGSQ